MNTGERVKSLRKELKLSQSEFGNILGVSKSAVSIIEKGSGSLSERNAKLICKEFNVDYFWLTEGTGEMFIKPPDDTKRLIDDIVKQYKLSDESRSILEAYISMDNDQRETVNKFVDVVVESVKKNEKTEE